MLGKPILIYCLLINAVGLFMMGADKYIAKRNGESRTGHMRIPERLLFCVAFMLGGVGCCLGMKLFHHKIRKLKFCIGMPLAVVCNAVAIYFLICIL